MGKLLYNCALAVAPPLAAGLIRLWFSTCRLQVRGEAPLVEFMRQDTGIAAFWHYSFLYFFYYFRKHPAAVMVSASKDGEYIARLAQRLGHVPVRGSSNRSGVKALREMIEQLRQGKNAAIVADGSQGPARRLQPGCLLMAAKSGKPVFPMAWATDRAIIIRSWDRTVIPKPFARIVLHIGAPVYVPSTAGAPDIEACRVVLEERLNQLYDAAWAELGQPAHDGLLRPDEQTGR